MDLGLLSRCAGHGSYAFTFDTYGRGVKSEHTQAMPTTLFVGGAQRMRDSRFSLAETRRSIGRGFFVVVIPHSVHIAVHCGLVLPSPINFATKVVITF